MDISSILSPECVLFDQEFTSKKRMLEAVASHFSDQYPGLDANSVFSALVARERLGSTGIGEGIAIPHCRLSKCNQTLGLLLKLNQAIEFDAIDNQPVDIIFVLLVPEDQNEDHLKTLAKLAETFSNKQTQGLLRGAKSSETLYKAFTKRAD